MLDQLLFDKNEPINKLLEKYKVLSFNNLYENLEIIGSTHSIYRRLREMERCGFIKKHKLVTDGNRIIFYPTQKFMNYLPKENVFNINPDNIGHDLGASVVLMELEKNPCFLSGLLSHQFPKHEIGGLTKRVDPDIVVEVSVMGKKYKVAVEVELIQKSEERVHEKIRKYLGTGLYHRGLFIFTNKRVLEKYKEIIVEFMESEEGARSKQLPFFILSLADKLFSRKFCLGECQVFKKDEIVSFGEIFKYEK